ncbi:hypothetical protein EAF00_007623 [Botryotinia globosa]|nr:hypothetical protein EAF00_007623 [Botryotinia globosa]
MQSVRLNDIGNHRVIQIYSEQFIRYIRRQSRSGTDESTGTQHKGLQYDHFNLISAYDKQLVKDAVSAGLQPSDRIGPTMLDTIEMLLPHNIIPRHSTGTLTPSLASQVDLLNNSWHKQVVELLSWANRHAKSRHVASSSVALSIESGIKGLCSPGRR